MKDIVVHLGCINDIGELKKEYCEFCHKYIGSVSKPSFYRKYQLYRAHYDVVLINTILAGKIVGQIKEITKADVSVWIHEMSYTTKKYGEELLNNIKRYSNNILVVDKETKGKIENDGYRNVKLLRGCIEVNKQTELTYSTNDALKLLFIATPQWR